MMVAFNILLHLLAQWHLATSLYPPMFCDQFVNLTDCQWHNSHVPTFWGYLTNLSKYGTIQG